MCIAVHKSLPFVLPATQLYAARGDFKWEKSLSFPGKTDIELRSNLENLWAVYLWLLALHCWFIIHLAVCLTTGPKPLPNRAVHIVRSRASSFRCEYPLLSLRSSSSFLRLLTRLPVAYIPLFIFPSVTCCRRHFLLKMWPENCGDHSDVLACVVNRIFQ
jgi:hypothetical protein